MYGTVLNRDWNNSAIPWLTSRNAVVNDLIEVVMAPQAM